MNDDHNEGGDVDKGEDDEGGDVDKGDDDQVLAW